MNGDALREETAEIAMFSSFCCLLAWRDYRHYTAKVAKYFLLEICSDLYIHSSQVDLSQFKGFEWDVGNITKVQSRLDLATVEFAFQGRPYIAPDEIHSAAEKRWFLVNRIHERFIFAVFTLRGEKVRVVSARYMRKKEAKKYEDWFKED